MTDDPRKRHPGHEPTDPPAAPLRPPRGAVFTRDEIPIKRGLPKAQPLPPVPERHPVTISQVDELIERRIESALDEETSAVLQSPNVPGTAKAVRVAVEAVPRKDRKPVLIVLSVSTALVIVSAFALLAFMLSKGVVPRFLK